MRTGILREVFSNNVTLFCEHVMTTVFTYIVYQRPPEISRVILKKIHRELTRWIIVYFLGFAGRSVMFSVSQALRSAGVLFRNSAQAVS